MHDGNTQTINSKNNGLELQDSLLYRNWLTMSSNTQKQLNLWLMLWKTLFRKVWVLTSLSGTRYSSQNVKYSTDLVCLYNLEKQLVLILNLQLDTNN